MSTGQTLLTFGALALFGYLALNVNRMNINAVRFSVESQRDYDAIHFGQSISDMIYATPPNLIDARFSVFDTNNDSEMLQFVTEIGDTLFCSISLTNHLNLHSDIDGILTEIAVFRRIDGNLVQRAGFIVSIPNP
jgi:hypothetical protein